MLGIRQSLACAVAALVVLAALVAPAQAAGASCKNENVAVKRGNAGKVGRAVLCLVNRERKAAGLRRLKANKRLKKAARRHSKDMVRRGYFSHRSPSGGDMVSRARQSRYITARSSWSLGENIAWGQAHLSSAKSIVRGWMRSAPHRANILNGSMREAGSGVVRGTPSRANRGGTFTLLLGRRG